MSLFNSIPALIDHISGAASEPSPADAERKSLIGRIGGFFRRR